MLVIQVVIYQSDIRIEFINSTVSFYSYMTFRNLCTTDQACFAKVAGLCIYFKSQ